MPRIAIVGAGLTGLYTAWRLQERGYEVTIFEARDRIGGRVLTKTVTLKDQSYAFDLGPTWYWPETERLMTTLMERLQLPVLVQLTDGLVAPTGKRNAQCDGGAGGPAESRNFSTAAPCDGN